MTPLPARRGGRAGTSQQRLLRKYHLPAAGRRHPAVPVPVQQRALRLDRIPSPALHPSFPGPVHSLQRQRNFPETMHAGTTGCSCGEWSQVCRVVTDRHNRAGGCHQYKLALDCGLSSAPRSRPGESAVGCLRDGGGSSGHLCSGCSICLCDIITGSFCQASCWEGKSTWAVGLCVE